MVTLVRLEAEGDTLDEVVKDIDAAAKAIKVPDGLHVHDEHYGREQTGLYKGRRVYKFCPPQITVQPQPYWWNVNGYSNVTGGTVSCATGVPIEAPTHPRQKNAPRAKK